MTDKTEGPRSMLLCSKPFNIKRLIALQQNPLILKGKGISQLQDVAHDR